MRGGLVDGLFVFAESVVTSAPAPAPTAPPAGVGAVGAVFLSRMDEPNSVNKPLCPVLAPPPPPLADRRKGGAVVVV